MNRDLVLSAVAAAALHGAVLVYPRAAALVPVVALKEPLSVMVIPKFEPDEPPPVEERTDTPEKSMPDIQVPQQENLLVAAKPEDITMPFVPTVEVNVPGIATIPTDLRSITEGARTGPVFRLTDLDRAPRTRAQISPVYPPEAKRDGRTGTVHVEFTVDENGRVSDPRIVETTDRIFNDATIAAVLKWRFEPGQRLGRGVRFRMIAPVVFSLND